MRAPIQIVDCATKELVEAELFDEVTVEHFLETQKEWRPVVVEAAKQMVQARATRESIPRHWHWDWSSKDGDLRVLAFSFFGISVKGKLQGLMKLETVGRFGRITSQKGKPLIYVDYLETAPWNIKLLMHALGRSPEFGAIGTRLIEAGVRKSLEEGFRGRLALHSLSVSERFYLDVCGMTGVARDLAKQGLLWCEFTPEQAEKFLNEGAA
ncbi:MAG: hypothetical protein ACLQU1_38460 [Bryobacteraceae bacterium]